ncbi:MAG: acylneuraminate cytidylyltransferase family protein [Muribaculaceae bacterium]|nr:acylneuraminate cytidylyltransferase family protein [Muribaculaceae bacterium]MDE6332449.1 acylneuraminate cytidylyltransferase family protein [Muribaculaceae bacterium]
MHRPLIIIPARGGSKGIPRKNIKLLDGKPLIAYSIEVAGTVAPDRDLIILSTDDAEIARVAREWGLDVPYMRPDSLAGDTTGTREVLLHAMDWADSRGITYDCVLLLQPTSPLRTADDVRKALDLYSPDIDMVVSVVESAANPYYDCFETTPDGFLRISKGDGSLTRRQDAPDAWQYNGAIYVINPESLRQMPMGAFPRRIPMIMKRENSIDLDTPLDWTIAEAIMNSRK